MAHYLVTGCAGFIGSRVASLLLEAGHTVVGADSLNDAYDQSLKDWRLQQLAAHPHFRFAHGDIAQRDDVAGLFRETPYDAIFNLAARAGVRYSVINPHVYYEANLTGTLNLLEACRQHGIAKFVLASTSSMYGADNPVPYHEDLPTDRPLSPYTASKKAAEALCYTYHHLHKIDVSIMRYFTVYGPAGRPDMTPLRFTQRIVEQQPITIYGDGRQSRDFTFVDDIARGTIAAAKPLGYEVINLGSDTPIELLTLVRTIEDVAQEEAQIIFRPAHPADMRQTWADVSKAERLLGWRPQVSFDDGIRQLVDWYRAERAWASTISTVD